MTAHEILEELNGLLRERFPEADFREAYSPETGGRLLSRITLCGQVGAESTQRGQWSARLDYLAFLPRGASQEAAEPVLSLLAELAGERFPALSSVKRGTASRDKATGLLAVPCSAEFGGSGGGADYRAVLGGREYRISGWKTAIAEKGDPLIAIGESEPFAVRSARTEYTVELEGLASPELERLAGFTAELGEPPEIYLGCRWKSLSAAEGKAVFSSTKKR